ncbi:MAG: hypothetical protein KDK50_01485, partial [Chlamydiia bacterium]|nr:hypothetical protein [Chlamydiia bacterium]
SGSGYMKKIKYGAAQISKGVANYFPKAVYLSLAAMCLDAAKSNDIARITALALVAYGYFCSRNNLLATLASAMPTKITIG